MNNITLKLATEKDVQKLLSIERSLKNLKTYSPILTKKEMVESLKKGIKHIIEKDGEIVGSYAYEIKSKNRVNIGGPAILSKFQGQGIGKEVTAKILAEIGNVKRIDLEIHPRNVPSLNLFKSFGFKEESRKENYFGDGEPRIILSKTN